MGIVCKVKLDLYVRYIEWQVGWIWLKYFVYRQIGFVYGLTADLPGSDPFPYTIIGTPISSQF